MAMNAGIRFRQIVLASLLLAIGAYCIADGAFLMGVAAIAVACFAWWLTEHGGSRPVSSVLVNLAVVAVLWYAVVRAFDRGVTVSDICELIIVIQLIKLFDRKSARDYAQLLLLSMFLAIGAMLTSNTLGTGVVLIVYIPVLILAVMFFQIYAGVERTLDLARADGVGPGGGALVASVGGRFGVHLRRVAVFAALVGLGASIVVFVVIPRGVGAEVLGSWGNPSIGSVTGFTDRVRLGSGGLISESSVPVLDMVVEDEKGQHLGSSGSVYYLRGAVLDTYEDGQWSRSAAAGRSDQGVELRAGHGHDLDRSDGVKITQRIVLRNSSSDKQPLFASWRPSWVMYDHPAVLVSNSYDGSLRRKGQPGRVSYSVGSIVAQRPKTLMPERVPVSFPSSVIRGVAQDVLSEQGIEPDPNLRRIVDDRLAATAIRNYLRTSCTYTLDLAEPQGGQDPIEWFLVDEKSGHCEYFASAMAAMCRSVGIRARVITGYVAVEFNPSSLHYVVRESNAHAWVEVELGGGNWREMDPTPPGDLQRIHAPPLGPMAKARQWLDALTYAWNTSVVGFDESKRTSFLGDKPLLGRLLAQESRRSDRNSKENRFGSIGRAVGAGAIAFGAIVILGLGGAEGFARVRKMYQHRQRYAAAAAVDPEFTLRQSQARFYMEMLGTLSRLGLGKPDFRPPLCHAMILAEEEPSIGREVSLLVRLYYKLEYGRELLCVEEQKEAQEALARLKAASTRDLATG